MKFVAVGSAGFFGRHAANAVHAAGHECAVLDVIDIPATLRAAGMRWQAESSESVDDLWRASSSADVEKVDSAVENPPLGAELNGLAEIVVAECPAPLSFGVPRPGDISPARMSATKARNLLGWMAGVSFAEGLRDLFVHHCAAAQYFPQEMAMTSRALTGRLVRRLGGAVAQRLGTRLWIASNTALLQVESAEGDVYRVSKPEAGVFRVACFSPYATWDMVSAWELTVLRALARRGCDTRLLLCDAVSPTCDLVWADGNPNQQRCLVCQSRAAGAARLQHHPFEWISRYVDAADRAAAIDWAAALPDGRLRHAQLGDDDLGEWCFGSMKSHFRGPRLDLDDPGVRRVYREYLSGAAQALAGCRAWLAAVQPDVLWLFNGRLALTRVAFEAARGLGIRVICHERGMVRNSLRLWENERCSQYRGRREAALANARQPLTAQQSRQVLRWLDDRRHSRNYNRQPFLRKRRPSAAQSLAAAGVSAADRILLALTSSDHEFGAEPDRNLIFAEQHEWLMAIVGWATRNPGCRVVIRFHPNASPASWAALAERLPELGATDETASVVRPRANVSVVPPGNPLDTYALLDASLAVTTYGSTMGIEAAAAGKTVIVADRCLYHGLPWAQTAESPAHFVELLDRVPWSAGPQADPDVAAGAMRFFWDYHLGPSITSRHVRHPGLDYARITYRADVPESLDHGKDQGLDRITDVIMNRRPIYDPRACGDADAERAAVFAHLKAAGLKRRVAS